MALPTGQISMSQVNTELGNPTSSNISLNQSDVRSLASIPSGQISMSDLQGKSSYPTYGYFGGGHNPSIGGTHNRVQRIDFTSETGSAPGTNLTWPTDAGCGLEDGSGSYGYTCNGVTQGDSRRRINRIDFSNDSTNSPGQLPRSRYGVGGTSTPSYGYITGGVPDGYKTDRLQFSNNTVSSKPDMPYSVFPNYRIVGFDNPTSGYYSASGKNIKYNFSNETYSQIPGTNDLPSLVYYMSSVQTSSYGYYGYGTNNNNNMKKLDFSNDTRGDQFGSLPIRRPQAAGVYNDSYGYFAGGVTSNSPDGSSRSVLIDRFDFSANTISTRPSALSLPVGSAGLSSMLA